MMSVLSCGISVQIIHSKDSVSLKKPSAKKKKTIFCINWDWKIFFMLSWMTFVPLL